MHMQKAKGILSLLLKVVNNYKEVRLFNIKNLIEVMMW